MNWAAGIVGVGLLGFVLSPGSLLRRNAAHLAEQGAPGGTFPARLVVIDRAALPEDWKGKESTLEAEWTLDKKARQCALSVQTPEGPQTLAWQAGEVAKPGSWPALEATLTAVCGLVMASAAGGEVRGALEQHLLALGVDVKVSRLELLEREVTYALGKEGARTAGYWIGKEDYAARGLRWTDAAGVLWELRLKKGAGLLGSMELKREGQVVLRGMAKRAGAGS